jgi:phospholipase C
VDIKTARDKIEHVIVLMLENRSFDHVLGSMSLREGRTDIDGLTEEAQHGNFDDKNRYHEIHPLAVNVRYGKRARRFEPDPPHGAPSIIKSIGKNMEGFIRAFQEGHPKDPHPQSVLGYLTRKEQPVTYALADNFVVCDRWFSPVPSNTIPNRMYSVAGHCMGLTGNPKGTSFFGVEGLDTIFDHLPRHDGITSGHGWRLYAQALSVLHMFKFPGTELQHQEGIRTFVQHVREDRLPRLSWLEPRYSWAFVLGEPNDDHPPSDVMEGQRLIRTVVQTLFDNPKVWAKSLFILTYDEHGGFYDHVLPPKIAADEVPANVRFQDGFKRRGVRVPAILVSPFTQTRRAYHGIMDHCSILKFLEAWLDVRMDQNRVGSSYIKSVADAIPDAIPAVARPPKLPALPAGPPMAKKSGSLEAKTPMPALDMNDDMVQLYRDTMEDLRKRDPAGYAHLQRVIQTDDT